MCNKLIALSFVLALGWQVSAQSRVTAGTNNGGLIAQEVKNTNKIEIYPNPSTDYIIVNIQNSTLQNTRLEIRSIIGNEIRVDLEEIGFNKYKIPVSDFAIGYYFLVIKDENAHFKEAYKFQKN